MFVDNHPLEYCNLCLACSYVTQCLLLGLPAERCRRLCCILFLKNGLPFFSTHHSPFRVLQTFTRWDSAQFLEIAEHGYREEPSFAFFPGYPVLIRALNRTFLPDTITAPSLYHPAPFSEQERLVLSGLLISNVAFVVAALAIYQLTLSVLDDAVLASQTARVWCLSPVRSNVGEKKRKEHHFFAV